MYASTYIVKMPLTKCESYTLCTQHTLGLNNVKDLRTHNISTLCLKKVPTFKLSVTLSNLNRFSKFLHRWKAYDICYKTHSTLPAVPPHLRHVATLPWEIKKLIFCRYLAHMEENANKLHFKFTDFNSSNCVTVYSECIYVFLSKSCPRR